MRSDVVGIAVSPTARSNEGGLLARGPHEKKPGSNEPGLRYWPREADTITFQEGLLSVRATGGGGQMRNANAQRVNSMVRPDVLQQPLGPHVSHAETGGKPGFRSWPPRFASIGFAEPLI